MFKKKRKPGDPPEMGSTEYKIDVCREYLQHWQDLFKFFSESLKGKEITPEEEKLFGEIVYLCALGHFKFSETMGKDFHFAKSILKILDNCASLKHVQDLPDASFASMQVTWHETFIGMNKTLGHLMAQMPIVESKEPKGAKGKRRPPAKGKKSAGKAKKSRSAGSPSA